MRLIDADALYASLEELYDRFGCEAREVHFSLLDMKMNIEGEETVDPVKHGRWEMKPDPFGFFDEIPVCSECGCTTVMRKTYKFCSNCGAKMDEVEDG